MIDPVGKSAAELRALAEQLRSQAHERIVDALDPIISLALVVMALDKLAAQASPGPTAYIDLFALKIHLRAPHPIPVYLAPNMTWLALRSGQPRLDIEFDLWGMRADGWLLVYRALDSAGRVTLEYWIRLEDVKAP